MEANEAHKTTQSGATMDVVAPRPAPALEQVSQEAAPQTEAPTQPAPRADTPSPKPQPQKAHNGIGLAIFATVFIVTALAAMAVYAYLQTA